MIMNDRWIKTTRLAVLGLLLLTVAGCGEMAAAAYFLMPPKKVDAEYKLAEGKSVVILVDDPLGRVDPPLARRQLVDALAEELRKHDIAHKITSEEELARIRQSEPDFEKLTIRQVGELANADLMIWMSVTQFSYSRELEVAVGKGKFGVRLKVFDIHAENMNDLRLWPPQPDGKYVVAEVKSHELRACKDQAEAHEKLAQALAEKVAKLFYSYLVDR